MHTETLQLREIIVFLTAAALVVPLMHRLRISPVLGFLVVGLFIGPYGVGRLADDWTWLRWVIIDDREQIRAVAEFGVIFLLFLIGLDLSFSRLWQMKRLVFGLGTAQVLVSATIIGAIAYAFGNSPTASTILGACLALSSTAIVMELLVKDRRLGSPTGRVSFGVLLFQDLAVVPILFMVGVFGAHTTGQTGMALAIALGKAAFAIALILIIGRLVVRPFLEIVGHTRSRELFMAAVLLIIIATTILTATAGLSAALGAFLAGLLLSESEYRHQIEVDVEPFKGLLLGLFFISVGMSIDVMEIPKEPIWIPLSVIGLYALKAIVQCSLALAFGQPRNVAVESGLLLGQGGEFAFIIIALAVGLAVLPRETAQFMLIVTSLTMLLTPLVASFARHISVRIAKDEQASGGMQPPQSDGSLNNHVIIAGYGRVGQLLGSLLAEHHICHVALDMDAHQVSQFRDMDAGVYFGDASNPDILQRVGIHNAIALAVTMDNPKDAERVVRSVRRAWPNLPILARARDLHHATQLREAGASDVVPEALEASLELAESVFRSTGFSDDAAHQIITDRRKTEKQRAVQKN